MTAPRRGALYGRGHRQSDWIEGLRAFFDPSLWLRDPGSHDIFLSHRFADSATVREVKAELAARRFTVYLDLDDEELRGKGDAEVAAILRRRMQRSGAILFAVSKNSIDSKWMPWELGSMDGANGNGLILCLTPDGLDGVPGQEYLDRFQKVPREALVEKLEAMEEAGELPRRGVQPLIQPSELEAFARIAQWPLVYLQRAFLDPAVRTDVLGQWLAAAQAMGRGTRVGERMPSDRTDAASEAATDRAFRPKPR